MATVAQLQSCDGFTVEGPAGCLGWVEETWLDGDDHPAAVAVRTADGRRALLLAGGIEAVDPDAQEVLVGSDVELLALEPPRLASVEGTIAATWQATKEHLVATPAGAHAAPAKPVLVAARGSTAPHERALWKTVLIALACIAGLIAVEIALAFGVAYLVTGHPY
jgi:hypothetical protein